MYSFNEYEIPKHPSCAFHELMAGDTLERNYVTDISLCIKSHQRRFYDYFHKGTIRRASWEQGRVCGSPSVALCNNHVFKQNFQNLHVYDSRW